MRLEERGHSGNESSNFVMNELGRADHVTIEFLTPKSLMEAAFCDFVPDVVD